MTYAAARDPRRNRGGETFNREYTPSNQFSAMNVDTWRPSDARSSHSSTAQAQYPGAGQAVHLTRGSDRNTPSPSECVPAAGWGSRAEVVMGRSHSPNRSNYVKGYDRGFSSQNARGSSSQNYRGDYTMGYGPDRYDDRDRYGDRERFYSRRSYGDRGRGRHDHFDDRTTGQQYARTQSMRSQPAEEGYGGQYPLPHNGYEQSWPPAYDQQPQNHGTSYIPPATSQQNGNGNNYARSNPPQTTSSAYVPPQMRQSSINSSMLSSAPYSNPVVSTQSSFRVAPARPANGTSVRAFGSPPPQFRGGTCGTSETKSGASSPTYRNGRESSPFQDTFVLKPPREQYVQWSCEPIKQKRKPVRKLLVLDLNGALVYRSQTKVSHPRPFLSNFLEYLFTSDDGARAYDVLVWSSAQPMNVRSMVESNFNPRFVQGIWERETEVMKKQRASLGEGRLLDVWARDKLNLASGAYHRKVQTVKDLRMVTEQFPAFTEKTTVLLDDSALKAMHQPWSQIIIPEYDKPEHDTAHRAANRVPQGADGSDAKGMDNVLLGVVGILEAMRLVKNVPAWVRAGHINSPRNLDLNPTANVTMADLPTHESFVPWFMDPTTHDYWVQQGREALARRGILITHGLPGGSGPQGKKAPDPQSKRSAKKGMPYSKEAERKDVGRQKERTVPCSPTPSRDDVPVYPIKRASPKPRRASPERTSPERAYSPGAPAEAQASPSVQAYSPSVQAYSPSVQAYSPPVQAEGPVHSPSAVERQERAYSPSAPVQ